MRCNQEMQFLNGALLFISFCFCVRSVCAEPDPLPAGLLQISDTEAFSSNAFLVDKSQRKLYIYQQRDILQKVMEYPADIGKNDGDKIKKDDFRTPEGIYFFNQKLQAPEIPFNLYGSVAFTTNYPNLFDLRASKTGSGIWLHAIPDSVPLTRGSRGCVVVRDNVIQEIGNLIKLKETPILIYDQIQFLSPTEHEKRKGLIQTFVESWKQSWEGGNIEAYMKFYDSSFEAPGFKYKSWLKHKENLKKNYDFIKVGLSKPYILEHRNQLVIKTLQRYESNKHVDYGVKIIYATEEGNSFKILREEWSPIEEPRLSAQDLHR